MLSSPSAPSHAAAPDQPEIILDLLLNQKKPYVQDYMRAAGLDASGNQELVFIRQSSGTKLWDDMGLDAMRKGAWDSNPPKGALSADGRIHFVFIVNHRQGTLMAGIL